MAAKRGRQRKVAIVTGGGTGLGRDLANTLTRDGYDVCIIGRRADRLKPKRGEKLYPYPGDIGDPSQVKKLVKTILRDFGRLDVLVNCAAIVARIDVDKIKSEDVASLLAVNLAGTMNMTYACMAALRKTKGSVINFSSSIASKPSRGVSIYAATKGGVESFTKAMAVELAPIVRVNCVSPALVRSEAYFQGGMMDEKAYADLLKWVGTLYPMGRAGEPEDVSEMVAYLVSDKAKWLTGLIVHVDGGWAVAGSPRVKGVKKH
jgi:NAD(P)-dependent dehydrogenase (short-subunit alcohol dehydrogenase family)